MARKYNRVMLGRGGQFAEECRKEGYIGVGFNIAEDLTPRRTADYKKFVKECTPLLMAGEPEKTLNAARLGCGMLWTVICGLKIGDVVLSPINKKQYIVGEISGDYYYVPNTELLHRRPVKWYDIVLDRSNMSSNLKSSARSAGTCSDLTQYAEEIEALMNNVKPAKESEFTWIAFYTELAHKLLPFRNNIKPLIDFLYTLTDAKGKSLTSYIKASNGNQVPNIDPFSVMASFNRNATWENRRRMCLGFKEFLSLKSEVPTDFSGIPTVNPMRSFYFDWDSWSNIDALWDLFEKIIAGKPCEPELDNVLKQGQSIGMLTMAFYWIDAYSYLALDGTNRAFLKQYGINADKVRTAKEYFVLLDQVKQAMQNGSLPFASIPEFSRDAFEHRGADSTKEQEKPKKAEKPQTAEDLQYWWLTGSPKYWSPTQDWELGDDIDYTLYNEKGNKRRIFKHFLEAKPGDVVIAYEATPVLQIVAIGKVMSETDGEVLYIRKMEELAVPVPYSEILTNPILKNSEPAANRCQGSLFQLTEEEYKEVMRLIRRDNPEPIIEIEDEEEEPEYKPYSEQEFLEEVYFGEHQLRTLKSLLLRKKNLILQGAPGVGKTFAAQRLAYAIMGEKDESRVRVIQFHQNYSYEDFVMGYKPNNEGGFSLVNGIFYEFCQQARAHRDMPYFLVIDEINRGNMSKIFGELLQLIEADYRDQPIQLAYSKQRFSVPSNLFIIGMMNTADRSLAMIDYALRRRFCFFKMKPAFRSVGFKKYQVYLHSALLDKVIEHIEQLNEVICSDASLGEGFAIGHSYFCKLEPGAELNDKIKEIVNFDIIPMLEEYWFDDPKTLNEQKDRLKEALK